MEVSSQLGINAGLSIFYSILVIFILMRFQKLFLIRYGRRHRVMGVIYLLVIGLGVWELIFRSTHKESYLFNYIVYDICLGVSGILLSVTAALDFSSHSQIKNPKGVVSGTLSEMATVSTSEMWEHSFYQFLNLWQAMFLHLTWFSSSSSKPQLIRFLLLGLVTLPWSFRYLFPVNSFSANYDQTRKGGNPYTFLNIVYRVKKYQYLFYKHFLLHGLHVSVVITSLLDPTSLSWRTYWLCLNSSYVMEFFLQTLVKRRHMSQRMMLLLNNLLMFCSSYAALVVLGHHLFTPIALAACSLSWVLNIWRRGHELFNVAIVASLAYFLSHGVTIF